MPESEKVASLEAGNAGPLSSTTPLIFISHDARDAELAEAFGKLLKSVSAGMIKTFRSSDKKGTDGIDFGEEWYRRLMAKLQTTSDVVCLFTERSLDRPWILFEAGVAKGKLDTPVIGIALGVPLSRITTGPFYQFQNMDDSDQDLTKLVHQLARRVPHLELDADVVKSQVAAFRTAESGILKKIPGGEGKPAKKEEIESSSAAKLVEEMKALPSRIAERLGEGDSSRRRKFRRFHPGLMEDLILMTGHRGDPMGILIAAGLFRDDLPWLYEVALDVYKAARSGHPGRIQRERERLHQLSELPMRFPLLEEFGLNKELEYFLMEFPRMLDRVLMSSPTMETNSLFTTTSSGEPEPVVKKSTKASSDK